VRNIVVAGGLADPDSSAHTVGFVGGTVAQLGLPGPKGVGAGGSTGAKSATAGLAKTDIALAKTQAGGPFATTQVGGPFAATQPMGAPALVSKGAQTFASQSGNAARAASAAGSRNSAYAKLVHAQREGLIDALLATGIKPSSISNQQINGIMNQAFQNADAIWRAMRGTRPPGS